MIKDAIPSASSEGFDILLERLQSNKEVMVINPEDIRIIQELASTQPESAQHPETTKQRLGRSNLIYSEVSIRRIDVVDGNTIEKRAAEQGLHISETSDTPQLGIPEKVLSMKQALAQMDVPEKILDFTNQQGLAHWISGLYIALTLEAFSFYKDIIQRLPNVSFVWGG